ncbi:MAG: hypothetical protein Q4D38_14870 [Planctomycetia bacterium]|nr:hypothetical protein [Planctomycetia bacterium]
MKFPSAEKMYFTRVGLEQSTDFYIAQYKAKKFPKDLPTADVCCGIGGDLCALAKRGTTVGIDCSPSMGIVARLNLSVCVPEKKEACVRVSSAEDFLHSRESDEFPCVHIDPDRRAQGGRTIRAEFFQPELSTVDELLRDRHLAVVKLAPGTVLPPHWSERATTIEWVGRGRECRQQLVWFASEYLPCGERRKATIVNSSENVRECSFLGEPYQNIQTSERFGSYMYDMESTIFAAKLEGAMAQHYQLCAISEESLFFTSDELVDGSEGLLHTFETIDVLPLDRKRLSQAVCALGWGEVEVKKRGRTPPPEEVHKWLKLTHGGDCGTIFVVKKGKKFYAILARRTIKRQNYMKIPKR